MTEFADIVKKHRTNMHVRWERDDIGYYNRDYVDLDEISSTPTFTEDPPVLLTGVFTVLGEAIRQTVFGGMEDADAFLLLLPAEITDKGVTIGDEDYFKVDDIVYNIEEDQLEVVNGEIVKYFYRLNRYTV